MHWIGFLVGLFFGGLVGMCITTIFADSRREEKEMRRSLTAYIRKNDEITQGKFAL